MDDPEPDMEGLMLVEDPDFERVMECVFGIRSHEYRVYCTLYRAPGSTVKELANALDRDRSSIQRSLTALTDRTLIDRERRLLEDGGFVYQYRAIPVDDVRLRMHTAVDEWADQVHARIDEFEV